MEDKTQMELTPANHKLMGKTLAGLLVQHVWNEVLGTDEEPDNIPRILVHPKDSDSRNMRIELTFDTPEQAARIETLIHIQGLMGGEEGTKLFMTADIADLFLAMLQDAERKIKAKQEASLETAVLPSKSYPQ